MKPLRFHPSVQRDINQAMDYYGGISQSLADRFWLELQKRLRKSRLVLRAITFMKVGFADAI